MNVVLLVAPSGLGKTTACRRIIGMAQANNIRVAGLLSLPVYESEVKTAIVLHEIATGQEHALAKANGCGAGPRVGIWTFEHDVLSWGRNILASLPECDLLIIDEIGPLEFIEHQGLTNALHVIRQAHTYHCIVTLRPDLVELAVKELDELEIAIQILDESNREGIPKMLLTRMLDRNLNAKATAS